ncbi:hypothetical protein JTE90_006304 [Oedothorax gibbosus]|uniref:Uncharacterized protein n=1 Tax=Oedothorax gibbosus TaxID=931172 RepID=A0AAV6U1P7_9ARAC|nr:hypothetical protein JTE90_006304 [Oedothorax gibbosus]
MVKVFQNSVPPCLIISLLHVKKYGDKVLISNKGFTDGGFHKQDVVDGASMRIENYGWYEAGPDIKLASGALTAHHIHGTQWSVLVHPKADDYDDSFVERLRRPRVVNIVCRMAMVGRDGKDSDQAATVAWNKVEKGASGEDVVLASKSVIFGNKGWYVRYTYNPCEVVE